MMFKEALKVLIFLCLSLPISRYNASSPQRDLHDQRHKENKHSEDILDIPLMLPMPCFELLCREMMSGSQLLEKNVKGEHSFEDKLSKLSKHEPFRGKRSADEFSEDKSCIKELYEHTEDITSEGVSLGIETEDLSEDETSEDLSDGLKSEERSAGLKSKERSTGLKSEQRSTNLKSEERSANLKSEERSAGPMSEEQVVERNIFESETVNDVNKCKEKVIGLGIALFVLSFVFCRLVIKTNYITMRLQEQLNHEENENTLQNLEFSNLGSQQTPPPGYFPPSHPTSVGTPPVDTPSVGTPSVVTPSSQTQISVPLSSETSDRPPSYSDLSPAHESSNVLEPGPSR